MKIQQKSVRILQLIVTIILLTILFKSIDWQDFRVYLKNVEWNFVIISILIMLVFHSINLIRWKYLLKNSYNKIIQLLSIYCAGVFSNNFLPTGIGGDAVRITLLSQEIPIRKAALSVGLDRGLGFVALIVLVGIGLWYGIPPGLSLEDFNLNNPFSKSIYIVIFVCMLLILGFFIIRIIKKRMHLQGVKQIFSLNISMTSSTLNPGIQKISGGFMLSVVSQLALLAAYWCLFLSLDIEASIGAAAWLILVGSLSLLLPFTINGVGLNESLSVGLLGIYGIPRTPAFTFALLLRASTAIIGVLAGIFSLALNSKYLWRKNNL